jgi:hypothetical protein
VGKKDARVDAYIAKSAPFAKPILRHIRRLVHKACPEVEETIKWGVPHFTYSGNLCFMAAFKQHCRFGFWHGAMGRLGKIFAVDDLPSDAEIARSARKAMRINASETKPRALAKPKVRTRLKLPDELMTALKKNKRARATFEAFSYTNKKEYVEWIVEAKRDETRAKRLSTAIEWLTEGKVRNWKYIKK